MVASKGLLLLVAFLVCVACPEVSAQPALAVPLPKIVVDSRVRPIIPTLTAADGKPARRVAAMVDAHGRQSEFVENELLVFSDDPAATRKLVARWHGRIVLSAGNEKSLQKGVPVLYLVRLDSRSAKVNALPRDLRTSFKYATGPLKVSSAAGLRTLAVAARENATGVAVGLNWVMRSASLRTASTAEAASTFPTGAGTLNTFIAPSDAVPPDNNFYGNDATTWPYMRRGGPQDIDVASAWRALAATGKLSNKVDVLIMDSGFFPNGDFPPATVIDPPGTATLPGPGTCSGAPCPFHGTGVVMAGFAMPDNNFGAAGPGGPVVILRALSSPADIASLLAYLESLSGEISPLPKILNISASTYVPASVCLGLCTPLDSIGNALRDAGVLVFAAAGNADPGGPASDVDRRETALADVGVTWEAGSDLPCETSNVICVGGLAWNSARAHPASNYGSNHGDCCTVDLFGPFDVWVFDLFRSGRGANDPLVFSQAGTSVATPFAAGVAALVWAADPTLSANQVEDILLRTAHSSPDPKVSRIVYAHGAVLAALGGHAPPYLTITAPPEGTSLQLGSLVGFSAIAQNDSGNDISPTIDWRSDRDGHIGMGRYVPGDTLSEGVHIVTAAVTADTFTEREQRRVTIIRPPLFVRITSLNPGPPSITNNHFNPPAPVALAGEASEGLAGRLSEAQAHPRWRVTPHGNTSPVFLDEAGYQTTLRLGSAGQPDTVPIPPIGQTAQFDVVLTATDGVQTTSDTRTIQIGSAGQPPQVVIITPMNGSGIFVNDGGPVPRVPPPAHLCNAQLALDGRATDAQGNRLQGASLAWYIRAPAGSPIAQGETANPQVNFICGIGAPLVIVLQARDQFGLTAEATATLQLVCWLDLNRSPFLCN